MSADTALISENSQFSRPTTGVVEAPSEAIVSTGNHVSGREFAINCTKADLDAVKAYVDAGIAPATRRAYRTDLDQFVRWGGAVPATDEQLAAYIAEHGATLKPATLRRRLAALSVAHEAQGLPNPTRSPLVRATMRGVRRLHGVAQRQAKPLLREDLFAVLAATGDGVKDIRDRALLLVGFAGAFRRSELCAIDCTTIERVPQGMIVTVPRSKTDQEGEGRRIGIPFGRSRWCPVKALDYWLAAAGIASGPVFRAVDRHGHVHPERLSGEAVSLILRERAAAAGYDPAGYSGHSLRAGFATSAAQAGVASWRIRRQTGHASDAMLGRYVRDGQLFTDNAAGALL